MIKVFLISLLASLGAAAVAWGLYLESFGEKSEYRNIEDFMSSKRKSHSGQKWVFWGVLAEMILGFGIALWDGSAMIKTDKQIEAADPRKANISDMSATAILLVNGTNFNNLTNNELAAKMTLWNNESSGMGLDTLRAESFSRNDFRVIAGHANWQEEYGIRFHSFNFLAAAYGTESPVKTIDDVHIVRMDLSFLPRDSEIVGGNVELVFNNEQKMFQIPPQNDTNSGMGAESGFSCFVIATNGVQSSEKQFLYLHD